MMDVRCLLAVVSACAFLLNAYAEKTLPNGDVVNLHPRVKDEYLEQDAPLKILLDETENNRWKQTRIQIPGGTVHYTGYYSKNHWGPKNDYFVCLVKRKGLPRGASVLCKYVLKENALRELCIIRGEATYDHTRNVVWGVQGNRFYKIDLNKPVSPTAFAPEYIFQDSMKNSYLYGPLEIDEKRGLAFFGICVEDKTKKEAANALVKEKKDPRLEYIGERSFVVLDINTGKLLKRIPMGGNFNANHWIAMPDGENIIFAHEGITDTIADRINMINWKTGEKKCLHNHIIDKKSGRMLECIGHEMRGGDYVSAVRYALSELGGAIIRMKKDGSDYHVADYDSYWHSSTNPDTGEIIVADTMWWGKHSVRNKKKGYGYIIRLDMKNGTKEILKEIKVNAQNGANHPHPSLNGDGTKVLFSEPADDKYENNSLTLLELVK